MSFGGSYHRIWWKYSAYTVAAVTLVLLVIFLREPDSQNSGRSENPPTETDINKKAVTRTTNITVNNVPGDTPPPEKTLPYDEPLPVPAEEPEGIDEVAEDESEVKETLREDRVVDKPETILDALLRLREESGYDNSLIYYQQASAQNLTVQDKKLLYSILKDGWTGESDDFLPILATYEPIFELIRKGLAVDYSIFPWPGLAGEETPQPTGDFAMKSASMLCAQAAYYTAQGEYDAALDNYFDALKLGRDYGAENALVKTSEISVAVKTLVCEQISKLVLSGNLSLAQLDAVEDTFRLVAVAARPLSDYIANDRIAMTATLNSFVEYLRGLNPNDDKDKAELNAVKEMSGLDDEKFKDLINNPGIISTWITGFYDDAEAFFSRNSWDHNYESWEEEMNWWNERSPISEPIALEYTRIDNGFIVCETWMTLIRAAAGLETYMLRNGMYPAGLDAAVSMDLYDPFTGQPLGYALTESGFVIYSLGPDKENQGAQLLYSPHAGHRSRGDIVIGK